MTLSDPMVHAKFVLSLNSTFRVILECSQIFATYNIHWPGQIKKMQ